MKTALIINSHLRYPNFSEGKLNNSLIEIAKDFFTKNNINIIETNVEKGYEAVQEVDKHMQADIIILQAPVNWFSAPWIFKKYIDDVFNTGLYMQKMLKDDGRTRSDATKQYGTGGLMQGKKFMIVATWNAPEVAFGNKSQVLLEGKTASDCFLSITTNYKFCGVEILPDFNCYDVMKNPQVEKYFSDYKNHLEKYCKI